MCVCVCVCVYIHMYEELERGIIKVITTEYIVGVFVPKKRQKESMLIDRTKF